MSEQFVLTDATFFLDGVGTFGKATEVSVPTIKPQKVERKSIDGVGTLKLPTGKVELDTFKANLNCFYPEIFKKIANPFKSVSVIVYGNLMGFSNGSQNSNNKASLFMTCSAAEYKALCDKKEHDDTTYELNFDPSSSRLVYNNEELQNIDLDNNIYKVNGEDIRKDILKNLGIT